jgi:hypothetical protein
MGVEQDMPYLLELFSEFEKNQISYAVYAGYALEGKRGKITRNHKDVDVFCLKKDLEKVHQLMQQLNFFLYDKIRDLHKFQKEEFKIDFCFLENTGDNLVAEIRHEKVIFPSSLFGSLQAGKIGSLIFKIVPNEILKKYGLSSVHKEDCEFASSLETDENIFSKVLLLKL